MGGHVAEVESCFWVSRTGTGDDLAEEGSHYVGVWGEKGFGERKLLRLLFLVFLGELKTS